MKRTLLFFLYGISLLCSAQQKETVLLKELLRGSDTLEAVSITRIGTHMSPAMIDSLWLQKLHDASIWYDSIYHAATIPSHKDNTLPVLPTDTLKVRLEKLNQKTPFDITYHPVLEQVIRAFLGKRRKDMEHLMTLGSFYFPMFEQELRNYNVPLEVKYLPVVESALNPRAKSRAGALGLWQFMYRTGKAYGLRVNNYVDERSDPLKATRAAAEYLDDLYTLFKDWNLALAAYNSGPGTVAKAIRRSGGHRNYWNLRSFLPRETAGYVPAFYATLYLFEYARTHDFTPQRATTPYFKTDTVHVKALTTFKHAAEILDINMSTLQFLNPAYYLDIIPFGEGKTYALRLPSMLVGKFITHEDTIYAAAKAAVEKEKPLIQHSDTNHIIYRVRGGDYLGKIAKKYTVRVSELKRWNRLKNDNLRIGQRLIIYSRTPATAKPKKTVRGSTKN